MTVPESQGGPEDRAAAAEREALLKLHEDAAAFFREQLASPAGARARRELESRQLTPETLTTFGYGYAPAGGRDTLHGLFTHGKVPVDLQLKSGLVVDRDGRMTDRFRHRLIIPVTRETGTIVAFGGRALDEGQVEYRIRQSPSIQEQDPLWPVSGRRRPLGSTIIACWSRVVLDLAGSGRRGFSRWWHLAGPRSPARRRAS